MCFFVSSDVERHKLWCTFQHAYDVHILCRGTAWILHKQHSFFCSFPLWTLICHYPLEFRFLSTRRPIYHALSRRWFFDWTLNGTIYQRVARENATVWGEIVLAIQSTFTPFQGLQLLNFFGARWEKRVRCKKTANMSNRWKMGNGNLCWVRINSIAFHGKNCFKLKAFSKSYGLMGTILTSFYGEIEFGLLKGRLFWCCQWETPWKLYFFWCWLIFG